MIEHKFPLDSFIGGWYIPEKICNDIINYFHSKKDYHIKGKTYDKNGKSEIDENFKVSTEIGITPFLDVYPFDEYEKQLYECMKKYANKYEFINKMEPISFYESYNIQWYKPKEGFKQWHYERSSSSAKERVLVFMTYLNDVDDGGTDFFYQQITTPAKKGLTLIWPSEFTHTHKGQISMTKDKYLATGWIGFNKPSF